LADIGVISLWNMYKYVYFPFASLIPVLIYYYISTYLFYNKPLGRKKLLLIPFSIFLGLTLIFRVLFSFNITSDAVDSLFVVIIQTNEIFSIFFSLALLAFSFKLISDYKKTLIEFNKDHIRLDLNWLKFILSFILIFTFIWAYFTYRNIFIANDEPSFYLLWIGVATIIYLLGHMGIYKYGIIKERKQLRNISSFTPNLSDHKKKNGYISELEFLMKHEKYYLNPNLSLDTVAHKLNISASYLSRLIHKELNTSFSNYVHLYRIEEAKTYLSNPEFSNYTMVSIGLEAGFNSRSSFFGVFKKATGQTPLEFKKINLK
jgi:AraC-like DNA-binding protein